MELQKILNTVVCGDALDNLKKIPAESVDSVITSPPYWQLRDYGWTGQWGLEPSFTEYLQHLWMLMDEIHRILKPQGTVWINLGDSYGTQSGTAKGKAYYSASTKKHIGNGDTFLKGKAPRKSLLLLPHRFAIGCMDRGWTVRNDIIWAKPNCAPEAVKDRFAKRHEYIFLLTKSRHYYFDLNSIRDPYKNSSMDRATRLVTAFKSDCDTRIPLGKGKKNGGKLKMMNLNPLGKNPGSVSDFWEISNQRGSTTHYATYNRNLILKPILAGCPKGGIILDPFAGTGTTGIEAIVQGRNFIGIEGSEMYCELANAELQKMLK